MVVRMRHTRGQTGSRRSHHALALMHVSKCPDCGAVRVNHTMCAQCGKYKGRVVVDVLAKIAKKEKKAKAALKK